MRLLETGHDKVKKICEILKRETLDPAKQQADEILQSAKSEAERIVKQAQERSAHMIHDAEERLKKQEEVFKASLNLSFKQAIAKLKGEITQKLFNQALLKKIQSEFNQVDLLNQCIQSVFEAIAKEGFQADAQVVLSRRFNKDQLAMMMAKVGVDYLKENVVDQGEFVSGVQIKIANQNLTIDLTDETIETFILNFASDTFKKLIYNQ